MLKQQFFTCPYCGHEFDSDKRKPMILCMSQHTSCLQCVELMFRGKDEKEQIDCPFRCSKINYENIQTFRYLDEIIETKEKLRKFGSVLNKQKLTLDMDKQWLIGELQKEKTKNEWLIQLNQKREKRCQNQVSERIIKQMKTSITKERLIMKQTLKKTLAKYQSKLNDGRLGVSKELQALKDSNLIIQRLLKLKDAEIYRLRDEITNITKLKPILNPEIDFQATIKFLKEENNRLNTQINSLRVERGSSDLIAGYKQQIQGLSQRILQLQQDKSNLINILINLKNDQVRLSFQNNNSRTNIKRNANINLKGLETSRSDRSINRSGSVQKINIPASLTLSEHSFKLLDQQKKLSTAEYGQFTFNHTTPRNVALREQNEDDEKRSQNESGVSCGIANLINTITYQENGNTGKFVVVNNQPLTYVQPREPGIPQPRINYIVQQTLSNNGFNQSIGGPQYGVVYTGAYQAAGTDPCIKRGGYQTGKQGRQSNNNSTYINNTTYQSGTTNIRGRPPIPIGGRPTSSPAANLGNNQKSQEVLINRTPIRYEKK